MTETTTRTFPLDDPDGKLIRAECRIDSRGMIFVAPLGSNESDAAWKFAGNPGVPMKPEQCTARGGHCWEHSYTFPVMGDEAAQWSESCKHCPAERIGRRVEPVAYTYP